MIDTLSDPGAWKDAIRWLPFIADERDGVLFNRVFELRHDARCEGSNLFHAEGTT